MKRPVKPWRDPVKPSADPETVIGWAWEEIPDDIEAENLRLAVAYLRISRDMWRQIAGIYGASTDHMPLGGPQ